MRRPARRRGITLLTALALVVVGGFLLIGLINLFKEDETFEFLTETPFVLEDSLPDFAAIESVSERKAVFFEFLEPYIDRANEEILRDRELVKAWLNRYNRSNDFSTTDTVAIIEMASQYGMELTEGNLSRRDLRNLLNRVDVIPPSLAMAQAALESAWGTSRFAQKGNNLFGMWCYEPGCGIVPRRRPAGATYEVAAYANPRESFAAYLNNLNSNRAYRSLRGIRADLREEGERITGMDLANGLVRYSQEGWTYVDKIRHMIRANNLDTIDRQKSYLIQ